ncbi:MAG TPA: hypothetical protein VFS97_01530 [Nitrososphaeraceae archaeon]|nr:hypothetical protein [Nitrososphaeraceae archaeon]
MSNDDTTNALQQLISTDVGLHKNNIKKHQEEEKVLLLSLLTILLVSYYDYPPPLFCKCS